MTMPCMKSVTAFVMLIALKSLSTSSSQLKFSWIWREKNMNNLPRTRKYTRKCGLKKRKRCSKRSSPWIRKSKRRAKTNKIVETLWDQAVLSSLHRCLQVLQCSWAKTPKRGVLPRMRKIFNLHLLAPTKSRFKSWRMTCALTSGWNSN